LDSFPEFRGNVYWFLSPSFGFSTYEISLDEKDTAASATERVRYTKGHWQDINNCRTFLEEIAKEQGFDPLDLRSWDSLGTTEIIKRVCVSFPSPPPLPSPHHCTPCMQLSACRVGE